jgi:hypothetical protein
MGRASGVILVGTPAIMSGKTSDLYVVREQVADLYE